MTDTGRKISQSSFIGGLVKERDDRVGELDLQLAIPTWQDKLLWGFRPIPRKDIKEKIESKRDRDLEMDIDILIENTSGFWIFDPAHAFDTTRLGPDPKTGRKREEYARLEYEDGRPILADQDLGEALEFKPLDSSPLSPTTQMVLYLFKNNDTAIGAMVGRLTLWTQNTDLDVTKATLGE